ncbi:MAG: hypothetical protein H6638_13550 [Ardenticatenales bacterium]|nr:hypothetical protein [Ardenticatenales bacterium]
MNSDCKECQPFIDETERLFGPTIRKYGFEFSECEGMRQGRECQVMYRASIGNLLFVLQDGAPSCFLGVRTQSLPPLVLLGDRGDYNWYHVVTLTEIALGNLVYDMRVDKAIRKGKIDFFAWQSDLLAEHSLQLFLLLESSDAGWLTQQADGVVDKRRKTLI